MTWNKRFSVEKGKYQFFPIERLQTRGFNRKYRQIPVCGVQINMKIKKIHCSNLILIEFEYQNSGYSHDSMG